MAVLWCGGEDVDFFLGNNPTITLSGFRTGFSRTTLSCISGTVKGNVFPGGAVTSCWFSCRVFNGAGSNLSNKLVGLGKSGTSGMLLLTQGSSSATQLALSKFDGTTLTQLAVESGNSLANGSVNRFDMQVVNYGASATVNVFFNSILVITFTGNVAVSGVTSLDQVVIPQTQNNNFGQYSEFIVADEDLRGWPGLVTMALTSAGTTDQWTGVFSTINQTTISDTTPNFTNTATQDQQFNITDLPSGVFNIKAVKIAARAASSVGATATKIALGYNSGGTVAVGSAQTTTNAYTSFEELDQINPVTGVAFVQSDMNALQLDVRSS